MNNTPLLQCVNLYKNYTENQISTTILDNVSFKIYNGELISIVGSSGSGKSTFLHLLSGIDNPSKGEILFKGISLQKMSPKTKSQFLNNEIGIIYQFHHLLMEFSVLENVAIPLLIANYKIKTAHDMAKQMLNTVGLRKFINYFPHQISGGQRQRVAIARALINHPSLVIADEPTGNLDVTNAKIIFELIKSINQKQGTTFLVVTHDLHLSKKLTRQVNILNGKLIEKFNIAN